MSSLFPQLKANWGQKTLRLAMSAGFGAASKTVLTTTGICQHPDPSDPPRLKDHLHGSRQRCHARQALSALAPRQQPQVHLAVESGARARLGLEYGWMVGCWLDSGWSIKKLLWCSCLIVGFGLVSIKTRFESGLPRTMRRIKKADIRNYFWLGLPLTNLHLPGF